MGQKEEQLNNLIAYHYDFCFGCGKKQPAGLQLEINNIDKTNKTIRGQAKIREVHQGAPGISHGGIVASALDEIIGYLMWLWKTPAVTAHLEVNFIKPVPIGSELTLEARLTRKIGRKFYAVGYAYVGDTLVADSKALYIAVSVDHFAKYASLTLPNYIQ
jgi:acyl-coenzyme A thioesterase PaaI-like protein